MFCSVVSCFDVRFILSFERIEKIDATAALPMLVCESVNSVLGMFDYFLHVVFYIYASLMSLIVHMLYWWFQDFLAVELSLDLLDNNSFLHNVPMTI